MKIAINGTGVAGPALAWWLRHYGHEPVLFEKADRLRGGGYVIDFWGVGYDIAERMGLMPDLQRKGYALKQMKLVKGDGSTSAAMGVDAFRAMTNNRYLSIARGDLAATLFEACSGIECHFSTSIVGLEERQQDVLATLSSGRQEAFDLVIGADGLHSQIRSLHFGPEEQFEHFLGYNVAAFQVPGYRHRDELSYITHTLPGRQLARISLREDQSAFLFIWRDELTPTERKAPNTESDKRELLRQLYGDMGWEAPAILDQLDHAASIYMDRVSQIRMPSWSRGRVALLGDAAACVSLLAGEGTGLAIMEAYALAGELATHADSASALQAYERRLRPFIEQKQRTALRFAGFFAPKTQLALSLRDLSVRVSSVPLLAKLLIGSSLRDKIQLPEYDAVARSA